MEWKLIIEYEKVPKVQMLFWNKFRWLIGTLQWTNYKEVKDWDIVTEDGFLVKADNYSHYLEIEPIAQ